VSDSPAARRAQEPSPQNIVTDLRSRDRYMIAFNNAASGLDDATAVKTVSTKITYGRNYAPEPLAISPTFGFA